MFSLNNYPLGAMYDRTAPFAQSDASDECSFEHPDYEQCDGVAVFTCECGTECCESAIVTRRLEWKGMRFEERCCTACAELNMLSNPARLLKHAKDHICASEATLDAYQDALGIFDFCLGSLAAETQLQRYGSGATGLVAA